METGRCARTLAWALAWWLMIVACASPAWAQGEVSSAQARGAQYVFVIDDSGSMSKRTSGGEAADPDRLSVFAVRSLLSMLDDRDEATVVRLNGPREGEASRPIEPLSRNRAALESSLGLSSKLASYAGQQTPCDTALASVREQLNRARRPQVAQVVFFLTDGECTGDEVSPQKWLSGVDSHSDGLFKFYLLRFDGRRYTRSLERLAAATDGEATTVSAFDPTSILKPFASALSRSQGYEAYLLQPNKRELAAHRGARRVRLLAVAPEGGPDLGFQITPSRRGEAPKALGAARTGIHQYADGRKFRFAALDYRPGEVPVDVTVTGAGNAWKVVAVPEYRLFVDVSVREGACGSAGSEQVQFVEVGSSACVTVSLVNESGEVVTSSVAGRGTDAQVRYSAPGQDKPSELPANRLGDDATFTLERVNLERGDHVFRPVMHLSVPGSPGAKVTLRGAARTLQVSSRSIKAVPARFDLGEVVPGQDSFNELTIEGNFPPSRGRLVVEGRKDVPECVTFELSGTPEGTAQEITPNQTYSLAVKIDPYCGHKSFTREIKTAVSIEFDKAAMSRAVPSLVLPVSMQLVNQVEVPDAISASIKGGEEWETTLTVGGNHKKDVVFKAVIPPVDERAGWPAARDLDVDLLDGDGNVIPHKPNIAAARAVTFGPGGSGTFSVRVSSGYCCGAGTYTTQIALVPTSGSSEVITVPVRVEVAEAGVWSCYGVMILWGLAILLVLLAAAYVFNMFRQSYFINRDMLASRLVPLRWDDWGEPEAQTRQADDVKRMVRKSMTFGKRALNWLRANPLRFGLPGEAYHETVVLHLEPARDVSRSRVTLTPERDLYQDLRRDPKSGRGRMFASGRGGLLFFCVPDRDGRLGRLEFQSDMGFDDGWGDEAEETLECVRLRRDELLNINSEREADTAAGWRVG